MSLMRLVTDGTTEGPASGERTGDGVRDSHRRVITTTCQAHGAVGFTNLLVTKEKGIIVLNPHVANCCVLRLDEHAARALWDIFGEWLG
jgi:hypothetical protein